MALPKCFPCDSTGVRPEHEGKNTVCAAPDHKEAKDKNGGHCTVCHSCNGSGHYKSWTKEIEDALFKE